MVKLVFSIILPLLIFAQVRPARVDVYYDSLTGTVSQYTFGSGDETVENFSMPGIDTMLSKSSISFLRMGGFSADYYDWEAYNYDGAFYLDCLDTLILSLPVSFGIDSLLRLADRIGLPVLLTVNFQINDPRKAARMVEYCNGDTNTPMGRIRLQRGHAAPYNITYWAIGNEPDISGLFFPGWNITFCRHFGIPFARWHWRDSVFVTPSLFGNLVRDYCDSMRAHSPIPLKIVGASLANNLAWIGPVVGPNNTRINLVDLHYYPNYDTLADSARYGLWLASPDTSTPWRPAFEPWLDQVRDSIRRYSGGNQIDLAIFEYNSGIIFAEDPVWWNYVNCLFVADVIGHMMCKSISMAGVYCVYDKPDTAYYPTFSIIRGDSLSHRAAVHVIRLYRQTVGANVLKTVSNAVANGRGLEVYGSRRVNGDIALVFINKDPHNAYAATIYHRGFVSTKQARKWTITNDAPLRAPWNGTTGIVDRGYITSSDSTTITDTIPRYSVTALVIERRTEIAEDPADPSPSIINLFISPNPSHGKVMFRVGIRDTSPTGISLAIYDASGRMVRILTLGATPCALDAVFWDGLTGEGRIAPAGVYFARLLGGAHSATKSFVRIAPP